MSRQNMEDVNLTCEICRNVFKDPKLLPCLHSFCDQCIQIEVSKLGNKSWSCPTCNTEVDIPNGDTSYLMTNFWMRSTVKIYELRCEPNEKHLCSFCCLGGSNLRAVSFCVTCGDFLCTECAMKRHTFTTQTRDHKVVPLSDVKSGIFSDEIRLQHSILCPIHKEETLRYFCQTCDIPVCRDCIVLDHKDHSYLLPMEAKFAKEQEIKELLESIKCKMDLIQEMKEDISKSNKELLEKECLLREQIMVRSNAMIDRIIILRKALENELTVALTPIKKSIQSTERKIKQELNVFHDAFLSSQNIMQSGTDLEFLSAQKVIKCHLVNLNKSEIRTMWQHPRWSVPTLHTEWKDPEFLLHYKSASEEESLYRAQGITKAKFCDAQCPSLYRLNSLEEEKLPAKKTDDVQIISQKQTLQAGGDKNKKEFENEEISEVSKDDEHVIQQDFPCPPEAPSITISFLATYVLKNNKDYVRPFCTSIAWINDSQLVVVDANNEKIKVLSNRNEVTRQRTVRGCVTLVANSTYIACKLKNSEMQVFDHNLNLKCSFYDVSVIIGCCSNSGVLAWISGTKLFQAIGSLSNVRKMTITAENGQPMKVGCPMHSFALPNGKFVISDLVSKKLLFLNEKARLARSESLIQGAITADFESNIFIVDSLGGKIYVTDFSGARMHTLELQKCSLGPKCIAINRQKNLSIAFEDKLTLFEIQ